MGQSSKTHFHLNLALYPTEMSKASDAKQGFEDLETASTTESIESRSALKVSGFRLVALAFSTLGVIYSDVSTCDHTRLS